MRFYLGANEHPETIPAPRSSHTSRAQEPRDVYTATSTSQGQAKAIWPLGTQAPPLLRINQPERPLIGSWSRPPPGPLGPTGGASTSPAYPF